MSLGADIASWMLRDDDSLSAPSFDYHSLQLAEAAR
jgi:hypothetical protein